MEHNSIDSCCICLNNIDLSDKTTYKLDCNHLFHTECIINWFRSDLSSGRCPICNNNNISENLEYLSWYNRNYVIDRFNIIKSANKKNPPLKLKKELEKLKKLEDQFKDYNIEKKQFYKEETVKEYIKQDKKYKDLSWKNKNKIIKQKTKIVALFPLVTGF